MAKPLTAVAIANLKPRSQRYEISDPGCAGLRVVVFPTRRKSYILRFRYRGLQRKLTLGPCLIAHGSEAEPDTAPEIGTPLSLAAARELATKALRQAKSGTDRRRPSSASGRSNWRPRATPWLRRAGIPPPRRWPAANRRPAPQ